MNARNASLEMQAFYSVPFARLLQDAGISPHYRIESDFMWAKTVAVEDQYRVIMECRGSGLTDYQLRSLSYLLKLVKRILKLQNE